MDDKIRYWFQGFEQGVAALGTSQQEALFHECGKNCVQQGTLEFYQSLYRTAEGNLDRFFEAVNDTPGLRGEVVEPDTVYLLAFAQCSCPLVTEGYVRPPSCGGPNLYKEKAAENGFRPFSAAFVV